MKKEFKKGKFSIKRVIAISLSCAVVIPVILVFADAERLPTEFFDEGGWDDTTKGYAWFAYEWTDYDELCFYLSDESFVGYNYESWYGNDAKAFSEMVKDALDTFPAPTGPSSAKLVSYGGFGREAFIPLVVAVTRYLSVNMCETDGEIGTDNYRVIKFSQLGYSESPLNEEGLSLDEINYARIKFLYQLIIYSCYDYEKQWGVKVDLDYCSIPLMRAIESLWDKSALTVEVKNTVGLSQKSFEKKNLKINVNEIHDKVDSGFDMNQLKTLFPHAYNIICLGSGGSDFATYAICPAKTNFSKHQIIDTGSHYYFGIPKKTDDEDEDSKDETQMDTKEE